MLFMTTFLPWMALVYNAMIKFVLYESDDEYRCRASCSLIELCSLQCVLSK